MLQMLSLVVLLFYDDADPVVTPSRVVFHLVVDLDPFFPFLFTEISLVSTERGKCIISLRYQCKNRLPYNHFLPTFLSLRFTHR